MATQTDTDLKAFLREKARRLRVASIRATTEAGSGHPTSCLSAADLVSALFFKVMRYDPQNYAHPLNDRFVLSKGHAAPLLYAAWTEAGALPEARLLTLRRITSELEGHPTPRFFGADVATGSLGQGLSIGLGMALAARIDRLDYRVYVLMGDGETAEGSVWEAVELAAYYKTDNLVGIIDVNGLGQSQRTMYAHDAESYQRRLTAFGWRALVIDGHDMDQILSAFAEAETRQGAPTMIVARTLKGQGVSFLADQDGWHGKPLKKGAEEKLALAELNHPSSNNVGLTFHQTIALPPELRTEPRRPSAMAAPAYKIGDKVATREAYGTALLKLGVADSRVVALDGDTKNSTFSEKFINSYPERGFECFIAEQNMVGMAVGLACREKVPFVSTFATFLTRAFDQIRMAGISRANIKLVGSHVGVSIGEDGPSQMGLEDLAMMRALPEAVALCPADAVATERLVGELAAHYGISYLRLARPKTPVIYPNDEHFKIGGCKILRHDFNDQITIVAAGVTVFEALAAYEQLKKENISVRVLDAYSIRPIARKELIEAGLATKGRIITVEDHYEDGGLGEAVLSAVGSEGIRVYKLAVREVPRSGKPEELMEMFGINAAAIIAKTKEIV
ncbi:MAG: transketolase [Acidobacteria bacterium]|nr:transketolase [Acidobacteriota bacterium]